MTRAPRGKVTVQHVSGVACPECPHRDVVSMTIRGQVSWMCGWCSYRWMPTPDEIAAYNVRVGPAARLVVTP